MPQKINAFITVHDSADADLLEVTPDNPFPVYDKARDAGWNYKYIVVAATYVLKATPGVLHAITINTPVASASVTIYDATSAVAANKVGVVTLPATLLNQGPMQALYDVSMANGLTIVTVGVVDITVAWK